MNYYARGDWDVYCDRCKFKYKASELIKEWTGYMVCHTCFEPRHPQELRRQPKEIESVPWSRPTQVGAETSPSWSFDIPPIPTDTGAVSLFQVREDSGLSALSLSDGSYLFVR
jgi:hypothetical protein